jgi:hypothetical protein
MMGTAKAGQASEPSPFLTESVPQKPAKARSLGLTSATGLVIGSITGTGVFTMPAVLADGGLRIDQAGNRLHTIKAPMVATIGAPA